MASILESLGSFDPDIRFMVLSDLTNSLSESSLQLDPQLIEHVVKRLGDSSTDVQNQAVKAIGLIANLKLDTETELAEMILNSKMTETVRGVALKHVFQAGAPLDPDFVRPLLTSHRVFRTVEGVNALVELIKIYTPSEALAVDLCLHFLGLITGNQPFFGTISIIEGLSLTIPKIPPTVWSTEVVSTISKRLEDPLYMGLINKLIGNVPNEWLVPQISLPLLTLAHIPFDENTNYNTVEAALKTMTLLMTTAPEFRISHSNDIEKLSIYAVGYRGFDNNASAPSESDDDDDDDDDSLMWDSADEFEADDDETEEASSVRRAAAQLIEATGHSLKIASLNDTAAAANKTTVTYSEPLLRAVETALNEEQNDVVLKALYLAVQALLVPSNASLELARKITSTAIMKSKYAIAALGMKTTAEIRSQATLNTKTPNDPLLDLFEAIMTRKPLPSNLQDFIALLGPSMLNLPSNEAVRAEQILNWIFSDNRLLNMPAAVQLDVISWVTHQKSLCHTEFEGMIALAMRTKGAVQKSALASLPTMISHEQKQHSASKFIEVELKAIQDSFDTPSYVDITSVAFQALVTYLKKVKELKQKKEHEDPGELYLTDQDGSAILKVISTCLRTKNRHGNDANSVHGEDSDVENLETVCGEVLINLPTFYTGEAASLLANITSKKSVANLEKRLLEGSESWLLEPKLLVWAIDRKATKVIERIVQIPGGYGDRSKLTCLETSEDPRVHVAATYANSDWNLLASKYKFGTLPFDALNKNALYALLELNKRGFKWDWYTLQDITTGVKTELHAQVLGTSIAVNVESKEPGDINPQWILNLKDPLRQIAYMAHASISGEKAWELMTRYQEIRYPSAAAASINKSEPGSETESERPGEKITEVFGKFAGLFREDPAFIIATAKHLPNAEVSTRKDLENILRDNSIDGNIRSDALAFYSSWNTVSAEDIVSFVHEGVLKPDPQHVQIVSIGPFKHKADSNLPLRLSVLEALYRHLITLGQAWAPITNTSSMNASTNETLQKQISLAQSAVQEIVEFSLHDEHEIKVSAYKLLAQLTKVFPNAVKPHIQPIKDAVAEDLNRKLKDSAVKQDVERNLEITRVALSLRDEIKDLV